MIRALQILALLLVLAISASAQTFTEGDYQINRKKATAGFEVAELLAGDNITFGWNNTNKTLTITGSASSSGTVTSFSATDSTGIDFTVTNPTTTPTLSLALTKAAVGLSNVENTALTTWTGSTNLTTLGTITTGTWNGTAIADTYIASAATWNAKQAALVSGTNIKTINSTSLLGSGNIVTGNVSDGDTLTTGLTFPSTGLQISSIGTGKLQIATNEDLSANRTLTFTVEDGNKTIALFADLTVSNVSDISGTNTGDITLSGTGGYLSLSGQTLTRSLINLGSHVTGTLPVANGGVDPLVTTADNGVGNGRIGLYDTTLGDFKNIDASANGFEFGSERVTAASFQGDGSLITALNASNLTSGTVSTSRLPTIPVANGGTSSTTLSANAVLLGNGTSALQTVAPSTSGNVLTSNGTTWTSTAPTVRNPAGSGSELQFRSTGTAFGALTNSSVSGSALFLGAGQALATTSTAIFTARNTTAATVGVPVQISPSIVLEGQGWKTDATAASQTVRFRQNVLPVQGTTNPSATWRLQSEINNSGTWTDRATVDSTGLFTATQYRLSGNTNSGMDLRDAGSGAVGILANGTRVVDFRSGGVSLGSNPLTWGSTPVSTQDIILERDAAAILAQRNGTNAQIFRIYETDSGANDEYIEISAASGTNLIRPQATGTGTASVVRYHTTTTVFWTSGSGSPEGVITAGIGSLYTDTANGLLYRKTSGTGSTGWVNP